MINVKVCSAVRHSCWMSVQFLGLLAAAKEQTGGGPGRSENPEVPDGNGTTVLDQGGGIG